MKRSNQEKSDVPVRLRTTSEVVKAPRGRASQPSTRGVLPVTFANIKEAVTCIETLTIKDPEAADALGNIVRLGNSGVRWLVVSPGKRYSRQSMERLAKMGDRLFAHRHNGGIETVTNYFLSQVAISGVVSGEIVINKQRDGVEDIYPVDIRDISFDNDPDLNYPMYIQVRGGKQYLDMSTYNYIPLSTPLSGVPYPLPPLYSALEETQGLYNIIESIRDGALKQKLLGLLTVKLKRMAQLANQSDESWRAEQANILGDVAEVFSEALKDGLLVHFDDAEPDFLSFAGDLSKWAQIVPVFEKRTARSLNFAWIREQGTLASAYMSIQLEKMLSEIQSLQALLALLLSRAGYLDIVFGGIPVIKVIADPDKHSLRIMDKLNAQADFFKKLKDMEVVDKYMIADELGYTVPETELVRNDAKMHLGLMHISALRSSLPYMRLYGDIMCVSEFGISHGRIKIMKEYEFGKQDIVDIFNL